MENKNSYVKMAAVIALVGNALLAVLKIVVGILGKSSALVGDGIDSSSDVFISIVTLVIIAIIAKPADKQHPWGHRRAETIATAFLSFFIFFMGAQLIINAISALIQGSEGEPPSLFAMIVASISIVCKGLLAVSQFVLGKKGDSAIIKANAKNMTADMAISLGVLVGLIISITVDTALPDKILTIFVGLWIIKTAVGIFKEANLELMDGTNAEAYGIIAEAVDEVEGASNPHRARMRKVAGLWDISFDINVSPDCSMVEAHAIATRVEEAIKQRLPNVFDIMIHLEPIGENSPEAFGLSAHDMRPPS